MEVGHEAWGMGHSPRSEDRLHRGRPTNSPRKRLFEGPEEGSAEGEVGMEWMNLRLKFFRKQNVIVLNPTWQGRPAYDPNQSPPATGSQASPAWQLPGASHPESWYIC